MAVVLALLTAASWGAGDFLGGTAAKRQSIMRVAVGVQVVGVVGLALTMPFFGAVFSWRDLLIGASAGGAGLLGLMLLYRGLARGPMAVVAPLSALMSATVPVAWGLANGERPGWIVASGLVLGLTSIVVISREPRRATDRQITLEVVGGAIAAGVGFGLFLVIMSETAEASAPWPVFGARAFAVAAALIVVAATGLHVGPDSVDGSKLSPLRTGDRLVIVMAGICDTAANVFFLYALERGSLAPVAVLSSLYPVMTVILARIVFDEKLDRPKFIGLALALLAVGLIAGG